MLLLLLSCAYEIRTQFTLLLSLLHLLRFLLKWKTVSLLQCLDRQRWGTNYGAVRAYMCVCFCAKTKIINNSLALWLSRVVCCIFTHFKPMQKCHTVPNLHVFSLGFLTVVIVQRQRRAPKNLTVWPPMQLQRIRSQLIKENRFRKNISTQIPMFNMKVIVEHAYAYETERLL